MPKRVKKCHDKDRKNDGKQSPAQRSRNVELEEDRAEVRGHADPSIGERRDTKNESNHRNGEDADQNCPVRPPDQEKTDKKEPQDRQLHRCLVEVADVNRSPFHAQAYDTRFIQPDETQE